MTKEFQDLRDNAPKNPDYTCGYIDPVIEDIQKANTALEDVKSSLGNILDDMESAIEELRGHANGDGNLEQLRAMNIELRENGSYWFQVAKELCEDKEKMREIIRSKDEVIEQLKQGLAAAFNPSPLPPQSNGEEPKLNNGAEIWSL